MAGRTTELVFALRGDPAILRCDLATSKGLINQFAAQVERDDATHRRRLSGEQVRALRRSNAEQQREHRRAARDAARFYEQELGQGFFARLGRSASAGFRGAFKIGGIGGGGGGGILGGAASVLGGNLLTSALTGAVSAAGQGIKAGFDFNKLKERTLLGFEIKLGGKKEAEDFFRQVEKFTADTPLELDEALSSVQRLMVAFSAPEALQAMRAITDEVAKQGKVGGEAQEQINGVGLQLQQILIKNKLQQEELVSLAERQIDVYGYLTKGLARENAAFAKLTTEEQKEQLNELIRRGQIDARAAVVTIIRGFEQDAGGTAARIAKQTAEGLESKISDSLNRTAGIATESAFQRYKQFLNRTNEFLQTGAAERIAGGISASTGALFDGLEKTLSAVSSGNLGQLGFDAVTSAAGGAVKGAKGLYDAGANAAGQLEQGWRDKADQHSPSRVFDALGYGAGASLLAGFVRAAQEGEQDIREVIERVAAEFKRITGKRLPVVVGQTETHTKLGFDHSRGADIAVNPNTEEGKLVMRLLAGMGVPALAQGGFRRSPRTGRVTSTGPHIHAGPLSVNLDRGDAFVVSEFQGEGGSRPDAARSRSRSPVPVVVTNAGSYPHLPGTPFTPESLRDRPAEVSASDRARLAAMQEDRRALREALSTGGGNPIERAQLKRQLIEIEKALATFSPMSGDLRGGTGRFAGPGNQRAFAEWLHSANASTPGGPVLVISQADFQHQMSLAADRFNVTPAAARGIAGAVALRIQSGESSTAGGGESRPDAFADITDEHARRVLDIMRGTGALRQEVGALATQTLPQALASVQLVAQETGDAFGQVGPLIKASRKDAEKEAEELARTVSGMLGGVLTSTLRGQFREGLRGLRDDFLAWGVQLAEDWAKSKIFNLITGGKGAGAGSGGGLSLGSIFDGIKSLFGGGGAKGTPPFVPSVGGFDIGGAVSGARSGGLTGLLSGALGLGTGAAGALPATAPMLSSLIPLTLGSTAAGLGALAGGAAALPATAPMLASLIPGGALASGGAAAGASSGGLMASLGGLFTNPWTAVIGGGILAGFGLYKLFGGRHKTEKALRKAIQQAHGVDIKDMGVLSQIKAIGEQTFGKGQVRSNLAEVIRLEPVQLLIEEYAERTGQAARGSLPGRDARLSTFVRDSREGVDAAGPSPFSSGGEALRPGGSPFSPTPIMGGASASQSAPALAGASGPIGEVLARVIGRAMDEAARRSDARQEWHTRRVEAALDRTTSALSTIETADEGALLQRGINKNPDAIADGFDMAINRNSSAIGESLKKMGL